MRIMWKPEDLIRYEDESILVVRKPAGMAVESKKVTETDLESLLKNYRMEKGERPEVFIIQRLDQPVEGLMVLAKTKQAARNLSGQLRDGTIRKIYRAKVEGKIPKDEGELRDYLKKDPKQNKTAVVSCRDPKMNRGRQSRSGNEGGWKTAILTYRKAAEDELEIELKTGRHHQIRAQLSHAGIPICGDRKYGAKTGGQLCLASCRLTFLHPKTQRKMEFYEIPSFEDNSKNSCG